MLAIKSWLTALCILSARTKPLHYVASSTTTAPKSGLSVYINTTGIGVRAEGRGGGLSIRMVKGLLTVEMVKLSGPLYWSYIYPF
jgi:hypothetical protein